MVNWTADKDQTVSVQIQSGTQYRGTDTICSSLRASSPFTTSRTLRHSSTTSPSRLEKVTSADDIYLSTADHVTGCTPKAVGHRLSNLRNSGKMLNSGGSSATPKKMAVTPRTPRTPASGRVRAAKASAKKNVDNETSSEDAADEELSSPSVAHKRARTSKGPKSYAESDATSGDDEEEFTPMSKRVKAEPIEDEGVAGTISNHTPVEEEDEAVAFV